MSTDLFALYKRVLRWVVRQPSPLVLFVKYGHANDAMWIGCPLASVKEREEFLSFLAWSGATSVVESDYIERHTVDQNACRALIQVVEDRLEAYVYRDKRVQEKPIVETLERWLCFASAACWYETKAIHTMRVALDALTTFPLPLHGFQSVRLWLSDSHSSTELGQTNHRALLHLIAGYLLWQDFPLYFLGVERRIMSVYDDLYRVQTGVFGDLAKWFYHIGAKASTPCFRRNMHSAIIAFSRTAQMHGLTSVTHAELDEWIHSVPVQRVDGVSYTKSTEKNMRSAMRGLVRDSRSWEELPEKPSWSELHQLISLEQAVIAVERFIDSTGISVVDRAQLFARLSRNH